MFSIWKHPFVEDIFELFSQTIDTIISTVKVFFSIRYRSLGKTRVT